MILGVFFWALCQMPASVLVSLGRQRMLLVILAITMLFHLALAWRLVELGWELEGIATATASAFAMACVLVSWTALPGLRPAERIGYLLWLTIPFMLAAGLLNGVKWMMSLPHEGTWAILACVILQTTAFILCYSPAILLLEWKTGFFSRLIAPGKGRSLCHLDADSGP